jgi:hypothetical protein
VYADSYRASGEQSHVPYVHTEEAADQIKSAAKPARCSTRQRGRPPLTPPMPRTARRSTEATRRLKVRCSGNFDRSGGWGNSARCRPPIERGSLPHQPLAGVKITHHAARPRTKAPTWMLPPADEATRSCRTRAIEKVPP